jgi:hypothetical protein
VACVYTGQPPLLVARPLVDNRVPLTCCPTPRWGRRATRYSVMDSGQWYLVLGVLRGFHLLPGWACVLCGL